MAASDKPLRDQRTLDIVFAISSILMLISVVWMMWQDYAREYKDEQREFRKIEVGMAQRAALELVPKKEEFDAAEAKVLKAKKFRDGLEALDDDADFTDNVAKLASAKAKRGNLQPQMETANAAYQSVKADVDSITSFLSIALEHNDVPAASKYRKQLAELNDKLGERAKDRDKLTNEMKVQSLEIDRIESPYTKAAAGLKNLNDRFDTQVKLAHSKRWGWGDSIRNMWMIDGFASPTKIHQFTINDIPIDYNFKYVTRYDRCVSCHVGIDRPAYTRENLIALTKEDSHKKALEDAIAQYKARIATLDPKDAALVPNPGDLGLAAISEKTLTPARLREFAAHPRLDLFVGSTSKHPMEKFGCSACHNGQGSGTSFLDASHSPNDSGTREAWMKNKHWEPNHMWDFPMLPTRFTESSCLKCHHEVTDLISTDNRIEAPKLVRGFNLIKENGCFGCHEISGWKGAARVGPDLRLEPSPALEDLSPIERNRAINDPDNRPGHMRKVGPALTRLSEKVDEEWIKKWLYSPSTFRPDTKMPHYYNLSTNRPDVLGEQKDFPNAEIASIAYFLNRTSVDLLKKAAAQQEQDRKEMAHTPEDRNKDKVKKPLPSEDETHLIELLNMGRLDLVDQKEFAAVKERLRLRKELPLVDLAPNHKADKGRGKTLFIERGCLSCHAHQGTEPTVNSEAVFGPSLAQIPEKFGKTEKARKWLIQWIINPQFHSPRSRMPQTHLMPEEAADVAAWLFDQKAEGLGAEWPKINDNVTEPTKEQLQDLARVYLTRMLSRSDMDTFLKGELKGVDWEVVKSDLTADEKELKENVTDKNALKYYLGKKAVSRLGCYGCHDIPGFENAKSIGVGLNDWGKKPADRLAFEDIGNFFENHYFAVPSLTDKDGKPAHGPKIEGGKEKEPYEDFYKEALLGHAHDRIGYLNQKVRDPRSYDFNRLRTWDDRARMPKFHFARARQHKGEDIEAFQKRILVDEAAAREAVATFILGLTAEQIPVKMINSQMTPDRLAEVKGRQVLDKYNCAGCHLIRPGVFEFKLGPKTLTPRDELLKKDPTLVGLDKAYLSAKGSMTGGGEIDIRNHINWVGRNTPSGDRLTTYAAMPDFKKREDANGDELLVLSFNPAEALRFKNHLGAVQNIPARNRFDVALEDIPGGAAIQAQADVERVLGAAPPYGGTFSDLLVGYLNQKDKKKYLLDPFGDSGDARASLPPPLIGQGERTQPEWLYNFLLNPQKVRKMSILRMPKFNMSEGEAKILVDYFAGVTRQINPGIGLSYPRESIPQRDDIDGPYWRKKTSDYVAHLKKSKAMDMDGKVLPNFKNAYEQRVADYQPTWEKLSKEREKSLQGDLDKLKDLTTARNNEIAVKEKLLKTDKAKEKELQKDIDSLNQAIKDSAAEKAQIEAALKRVDVKNLQDVWEEKEAYAADAYRLLTSRKVCAQCHQIGTIASSGKDTQGPPLALAHERLRPNFVENWVNKPQRFVPYPSVMPTYFSASDKEWKWQPIHAGVAQDQIYAVRDVLMNFPRVADMPINRLYNPDQPAGNN